MALFNSTRTQVNNTDQSDNTTESLDTGERPSSRTIRRSQQILSPVVVIPHSPLAHWAARFRGTGQSSAQSSGHSGNQTSTTRKQDDDRSHGGMSPAAKRSRRSDIGLNAYKPNQICLNRVTRSERPLTRSSSRPDQGSDKQVESQEVELSLLESGFGSSRAQADSSHSVSSSRSSAGSRRSLGTHTTVEREEPVLSPGPTVNPEDHSMVNEVDEVVNEVDEVVNEVDGVVNEVDEVVESIQDIRASAANFSTDKLLKLNRVTASLLEERLSKNNTE